MKAKRGQINLIQVICGCSSYSLMAFLRSWCDVSDSKNVIRKTFLAEVSDSKAFGQLFIKCSGDFYITHVCFLHPASNTSSQRELSDTNI
jgi:hypothetical protein